ncbi:MAG: hypothetical protein AAF220_04750 [Pseudomonadota bacterium]
MPLSKPRDHDECIALVRQMRAVAPQGLREELQRTLMEADAERRGMTKEEVIAEDFIAAVRELVKRGEL